jgi:hypothetical protein
MNLVQADFDNRISPIARLAPMRHLINERERKEAFEGDGVLCQIRIIGIDAFVKTQIDQFLTDILGRIVVRPEFSVKDKQFDDKVRDVSMLT